ncbi:MAG: GerAB/ArcD/ProY family transporter [Clostridia bacterium]
MKDSISTRQAGIILFLSVLSIKILLLPSLFYQDTKSFGILTVGLALLFDVIIAFFVCKFISKNKNVSFYQIICKKTNKFLAKVVVFLLFLFFLIKLILLINESYLYFKQSVFESADIKLFLIIFLGVCCPFVFGRFRAFGRTCEFFYNIIFLGVIVCLFIGFSTQQINLPYFTEDISAMSIFGGLFKRTMWFGDSIVLLAFMGKIDIEPHFVKKTMKKCLLGSFIVLLLFLCYFGLYQITALLHRSAFGDLVIFAPKVSAIGRLDLIPVITAMIMITIQGGIFFSAMECCFSDTFNSRSKFKNLIVLNTILILLIYIVFDNNEKSV